MTRANLSSPFRRATLRARAAVVLAAGALLAASPASHAQIPAPRQDRPVALAGGTIHTVSGEVIPSGVLVFEDGRITAIGTDVAIPAGAVRVDVTGRHVYPGLIDAYSFVGLYEIGSIDLTIDTNELGRINPNVRAEVAVHPESRHIGTTRSNGVLVTVTTPSGGLVSGMAAAMMLEGWTWEEMTLRGRVGLAVNWPSPANTDRYEEEIKELRDVFATAKAYRVLREGSAGRLIETDPRWEAMLPVLTGEVPVIVGAAELRQIQDAITWAEEEGVRLVLRGGGDARYVAQHLARKDIPVLLTSVIGSPGRQWEPYDAVYAHPAALHEAGVRFAITGSSSAPYANRLPYEAGAAAAFGLPPDEALRAVTLYPAQFLGIDDRVGSLEPGKDATLLVTTGNPLEYSTIVEQAYIQGRRIDMNDAHRRFFEKYGERIRQEAAESPVTDGQE